MSQHPASPPATPSTLWDFWSQLLWPRILTAAAYGLRPGRLGLAFFAIVIIAILLSLGLRIDDAIRDTPPDPIWQTRADEPWQIPWRTFIATPLAWVTAYPITTLIFGPISLFVGLLLIGAISRIAACEMALDRHISWWQGLTYSARFWKSLLGANLGPIIGVWLLALLLALFGLILLRFPGVNIVGAVLFPIALILGFAAAAMALIFVLGVWLITPAIMADGSDSIDTIQRAYAYVIDRPVRLALYLLLAGLGLFAVVVIAATFIFAAVHFAGWASSHWAGEDGGDMIWSGIAAAFPTQRLGPGPADLEGTYYAGAAIIRFWTAIPAILLLAVALSGLVAAATMVYLAMRRLCDGQDISEIWWPGKVEEAMAASMQARAAATANPPL